MSTRVSTQLGERGLGMLDFEDTLHADPTPILYRIPGTKCWGGGLFIRWFSNKLVFK